MKMMKDDGTGSELTRRMTTSHAAADTDRQTQSCSCHAYKQLFLPRWQSYCLCLPYASYTHNDVSITYAWITTVAYIPIPGERSLRTVKNKGKVLLRVKLSRYFSLCNLHPHQKAQNGENLSLRVGEPEPENGGGELRPILIPDLKGSHCSHDECSQASPTEQP